LYNKSTLIYGVKMGYLLTIDAGTGSARAVIFDEEGNQCGIGQEEWSHTGEAGVAGAMNFDCENGWQIICKCVKKAVNEAGINSSDILAVTATSMREGIVLYDKQGAEIWAVANVDSRAANEVAYLKSNFAGVEEDFYALSGQTFALGALPRILWVKNNCPSIYDKVAHLTMIDSWILYRLGGVFACDPSNAGTTGIFDLAKRNWVPEMATKVGLKSDIFPPIYEPGKVIAEVTQIAANECGLRPGTPVVMGGGDVQMGSAGLGIVHEGECAVLGGTFWQQVVNIKSGVVDPSINLRINPHVITGLSQAEGITFFAGMVMRWFRDTLAKSEKEEAVRLGIDAYAHLEKLAMGVPAGSYGIIPIFSDSMKYRRWIHAAPSFLNLPFDSEKMGVAALFRSLQENAAIVSAVNLEAIHKFSGITPLHIVFAGGAAKGFLWPQILADVTGLPVKTPAVKEATSLGAAFAAGSGVGVYKNISEASQALVKWDKEFLPNSVNKPIYDEAKQNWQSAYKKMLSLLDEGVTTPMWKAPGL
jgi:autoinducer 2 (AI-2) kinase